MLKNINHHFSSFLLSLSDNDYDYDYDYDFVYIPNKNFFKVLRIVCDCTVLHKTLDSFGNCLKKCWNNYKKLIQVYIQELAPL